MKCTFLKQANQTCGLVEKLLVEFFHNTAQICFSSSDNFSYFLSVYPPENQYTHSNQRVGQQSPDGHHVNQGFEVKQESHDGYSKQKKKNLTQTYWFTRAIIKKKKKTFI